MTVRREPVANNYLQFSEILAHLTDEEEAWLGEQLEEIEDELPVDSPSLVADKPMWCGPRFLRDCEDYEPGSGPGFDYSFLDDDVLQNWGRHLWLYAEECGNLNNVAWLVQKFLKKFRPNECWSLTFALTCSKPRVGEFGGGAVFVTAETMCWETTNDFVAQKRAAFETIVRTVR
jgi:hypothetical protein